jgi:hypothetical protein
MKKTLFASTLALAVLLGSASLASAAGPMEKLEMIKAKVAGGESKATEIHNKLNDYITRADEKGYDVSTAEAEMDQAEDSYDTLVSEIHEFKAMIDDAIEAGAVPGDGTLKAQASVVKSSLMTFKSDMLEVKEALKDLKGDAVPFPGDEPAL